MIGILLLNTMYISLYNKSSSVRVVVSYSGRELSAMEKGYLELCDPMLCGLEGRAISDIFFNLNAIRANILGTRFYFKVTSEPCSNFT